jgi:hypothetical protein
MSNDNGMGSIVFAPIYAPDDTYRSLIASHPVQTTESYLTELPAKASKVEGVGDINSDALGSGARYNQGKPPMELIPLRLLSDTLAVRDKLSPAVESLLQLGLWQERAGEDLTRLKLILTYLGPEGWLDCAKVFDYGQRKYKAWNWAKGMPWSVPMACAARHLLAMASGEANDPESGLPHRGHVFCNIVMLMTYIGKYPEGDDRPPSGTLSKEAV